MGTPIHELTIYSLKMLYGYTLIQSVIFCEKNLIFALGNLSIHMLMLFFVVNSRVYDSMFSQFVVYAFIKRNSIHTNPHICNLCPNQPFFQLLMQLSSMVPWLKWLVIIKTIFKWFVVAYATMTVINVIWMKVMMKSGHISSIFYFISK
jgi:hypothetical protein